MPPPFGFPSLLHVFLPFLSKFQRKEGLSLSIVLRLLQKIRKLPCAGRLRIFFW